MRIVCSIALLVALTADERAHATSVIRVGPGGFATLQEAVTAAMDGDVVLIAGGTYEGASVTGRGLVIVADGDVRLASSFTASSLPPRSLLALDGMEIRGGFAPAPTHALSISAADHVRVQSCALRSVWSSSTLTPVVTIEQVADAAMQDCVVNSNPASPLWRGRTGIASIAGSALVLDRCLVVGGRGSDGLNIDGVSLSGVRGGRAFVHAGHSTLFALASRLHGGAGGNGAYAYGCTNPPGNGGAGGHAYESSGSFSASFLDCRVVGGRGGIGGSAPSACPGSAPDGVHGRAFNGDAATLVDGEARTLECVGVVREGATLAVRVRAMPGDSAHLAVSARADRREIPGAVGVLLVGAPAHRIELGVVGATAVLDASLPVRPMPAGVEARVWHAQLVIIDAYGVTRFGSARVITVLDASF